MNILADIQQFHFLRPALLLLIIPAALACWALARTVFASGGLQKLIDPDLLPHLLMRGGEKRPWLFTLIFTLLTVAIIALAGPTWRKLPTPVYSNQDAVVILFDLSPSMMATDLAPDRLTRARLKILDILKQRKDGLTALVAYAGEAHVVTPLTDDTATIANLVPSLSPRIMPVPGSNIEMAVQEGLRLIQDGANGSGRLLAVTDGIAKAAIGTIKSTLDSSDTSLSILAVGSGEGSPIPKNTGSGFITDDSGSIIIANFDRRELSRLAQSTGGQFSQITVDDSDIARVLPDDTQPEQAELTEREFDQWHEEGPWLVLLLLPFALLLFRKGSLACALPLALSTMLFSSADTQAAEDTIESNLWQTPNQQGRDLLEEGNAQGAAEVFENSQWRGTARYRAGEYDAAAENFAQSQSPQGLYNLGNSLTQQGRFDDAIKAYDEALKQNPELADARHNRKIAEKLKELQEQQQQQSQQSDQQQNDQQQNQQQDQQSEQNAQQDQQQDQGDQSQQQNAQQDSQQQQSDQQSQNQQDQEGDSAQDEENQEQQQAQGEQQDQKDKEQEQQANAQPQESESPLDPETQQALDQWLRQIPDDPAGLMREKFKYESLQRRRAYRAGEWQPPENGATQRW